MRYTPDTHPTVTGQVTAYFQNKELVDAFRAGASSFGLRMQQAFWPYRVWSHGNVALKKVTNG